jgi:hypothetical protein
MKTPKIRSPYITRTNTQFIPRIFLKNGVMISRGDHTPDDSDGKKGVGIVPRGRMDSPTRVSLGGGGEVS